MGLRVKRNTPLVTSTDAEPGLIGFIVVLARKNETMAGIPKIAPVEATATAMPTRSPNGTSTGTIKEDASHMRMPTTSATSGGGTFSSSQLIATRPTSPLLTWPSGSDWVFTIIAFDPAVIAHAHAVAPSQVNFRQQTIVFSILALREPYDEVNEDVVVSVRDAARHTVDDHHQTIHRIVNCLFRCRNRFSREAGLNLFHGISSHILEHNESGGVLQPEFAGPQFRWRLQKFVLIRRHA